MDFEDTPEEAEFRSGARAFLGMRGAALRRMHDLHRGPVRITAPPPQHPALVRGTANAGGMPGDLQV